MKYDLNYLENMMRMYSKSAETIAKIRWDFVLSCSPKTVLDYGCGCGFFRAYRPNWIEVDSYDINSSCPQTGINNNEYDLVCLWDVFEHMSEPLSIRTKYIALTIPIKPDDVKLKDWYHFKPFEHLIYFNHEYIDTIFESLGFKQIKCGQPECPPRKDIWDFLYEKNNS